MNKTELVAAVSCTADMPKEAALRAVEAVFDAIVDSVANGEPVMVPGFGTFTLKHRSARKGRNPQTGEEMTVPESTIAFFKPGKRLKEAAGNR